MISHRLLLLLHGHELLLLLHVLLDESVGFQHLVIQILVVPQQVVKVDHVLIQQHPCDLPRMLRKDLLDGLVDVVPNELLPLFNTLHRVHLGKVHLRHLHEKRVLRTSHAPRVLRRGGHHLGSGHLARVASLVRPSNGSLLEASSHRLIIVVWLGLVLHHPSPSIVASLASSHVRVIVHPRLTLTSILDSFQEGVHDLVHFSVFSLLFLLLDLTLRLPQLHSQWSASKYTGIVISLDGILGFFNFFIEDVAILVGADFLVVISLDGFLELH